MNLIFIYGPPAAGKLTVAKELADQTGYKVFHNHLSIDAVAPIFDFGTKSFWTLVDLIRLETIAEAARSGQNLIYTFCYAKDKDDAHVEKIVRVVTENGGRVCFVLLTCRAAELERRVVIEERQKHGKVNNVGLLREILEKYELFSPVNNYESLRVDNTSLLPAEAAREIIAYYGLT